MTQRIKSKFHRLVNPQKKFKTFSFFEKIILLILCFFEFFYRIGFFLVAQYKRLFGQKKTSFKVISIGNLSAGGTGKSVVVSFLVDILGQGRCAVFLRGHASQIAKTSKSAMFDNGHLQAVQYFGDEAAMYAQKMMSPIVVGRDRFASSQLLEKFCYKKNKKITYIILDDGYQNYALKKDCEVVLIDARWPFENGHCLPAGKLREKDLSRSDVIIVTHADEVSKNMRMKTKAKLVAAVTHKNIFFGAHVPDGLYDRNRKKVAIKSISNKRFILASGVGSPEGVRLTVDKIGANIVAYEKFDDHHAFVQTDLDGLFGRALQLSCSGIIVTEKDWVKLLPLITQCKDFQGVCLYVVRVRFEFLSLGEYDAFMRVLKSCSE